MSFKSIEDARYGEYAAAMLRAVAETHTIRGHVASGRDFFEEDHWPIDAADLKVKHSLINDLLATGYFEQEEIMRLVGAEDWKTIDEMLIARVPKSDLYQQLYDHFKVKTDLTDRYAKGEIPADEFVAQLKKVCCEENNFVRELFERTMRIDA